MAVARGLVTDPTVLFADEPTGALDSLTGEHVMELLITAARDHGTTVVLVTHEPRVAAYADREVIVRDGRVTGPVPAVSRVMIRFGLRLTLRGGREALARLIVICAAVAIGVGLLLSTLAGISAVHHQNDRYAWLETSADAVNHHAVAGVDPVWWLLSADEFRGQQIGRVDVAETGANSPVPPGLTPAARASASTTPRRRSRTTCRRCPVPSWPTATPATWSARSARPVCRPPTR